MSDPRNALQLSRLFRGNSPEAARGAASDWLRDFTAHEPFDLISIRVAEREGSFVATVLYLNAMIKETNCGLSDHPQVGPLGGFHADDREADGTHVHTPHGEGQRWSAVERSPRIEERQSGGARRSAGAMYALWRLDLAVARLRQGVFSEAEQQG